MSLSACPGTAESPDDSSDEQGDGDGGDGDTGDADSGDGDSGDGDRGDGDRGDGDRGDGDTGDGDSGDGDAGDGDEPGDGDGDTDMDGGPGGDGDGPDGPDGSTGEPGDGDGDGPDFDPRSLELCELVNDYRAENGLERLPISLAMMTVARAHVDDLAVHDDEVCNMHSWSATSELWEGCCFSFENAGCMWAKPAEITASWGEQRYPGYGYENSSSANTPQGALDSWKGSKDHNDVILNLEGWARFNPWPALGCAVNDLYSVLWFGDATDPRGNL